MTGDFRVIKELDNGASSVKKTLIDYMRQTCLLREYDKRFMDDRRESFDNATRLYNNGVNVPKIYKVGDGYSIVEWIEGIPLDELLRHTGDDKKYASLVGKELLKMHSVEPHEQRSIYLQYLHSYNKKMKRIKDLGIDINLDNIVDYVYQHVGVLRDLPTNIVHGDFHPGNIVISDQKPYMIDLDVCKERNGIYDLASASIIENYPAFYYNLINNYYNGKIPKDFWTIFNLYSIIYILDYIFYSYRMFRDTESAKEKLRDFEKSNGYYDGEAYWYTLQKKGNRK